MKLNVRFSESKQSFDAKFGEIQQVSDGGYDRGYADGKTDGYVEGKTDGYNDGREDGYEDGKQDGYQSGKSDGLSEGYDNGYADGQDSMVDESKIIEKTVTGYGVVSVNDVSEIPHEVEVKLSGAAGKNLADFNAMAEYFALNQTGVSIVTFDGKRCLRIQNAQDSVRIYMPNKLARSIRFDAYAEGDNPPGSFFTVGCTNGDFWVQRLSSYTWKHVSKSAPNDGTIEYLQLYTDTDTPIYIDIDSFMFSASVPAEDYEPYTEDFSGKKVIVHGDNGKRIEYTANHDGVNVNSISPNMTVEVQGNISMTYRKSYGMNLEHNRFWDGIFSGKNWQNRFYGASWNDNTFYPNQDIKPVGYANDMFGLCEITDLAGRLRECGVVLDTSGITARSDKMFSYAGKLTTVPYLDVRHANYSAGNLNGMFQYCYKLKTIEGIQIADDGSTVMGTSIFTECRELENVTFYGMIGGGHALSFKYSPLLSHDSIMNVLNALKDLNGEGKTQTLTLGETNLAKLTDGEKSIATEKGWSLA